MTILLPTLTAAFAAFCVWLTVRIVNRRERWAIWTAVAIAIPVLYVPSLGPATSLLPSETFKAVYRPCLWAALEGPDPIFDTLSRWADLTGDASVLKSLRLEHLWRWISHYPVDSALLMEHLQRSTPQQSDQEKAE